MDKISVAIRTHLRQAPAGNAASLHRLFPGEVLFATGQASPDGLWLEADFSPFGGAPLRGWVLRAHCETAAVARPELKLPGFVKACIIVERTYNALAPDPLSATVSADYLLARAIIATGLTNASPLTEGSDGVGPLQVTSAEWAAFLASPVSDGSFSVLDRDQPVAQIYGAAQAMLADVEAFGSHGPHAAANGADGPFVPDYLDVLHAQLTGSVDAALALRAATEGGQGSATVATILLPALGQGGLDKLLATRAAFFAQAGQPRTVAEVVAGTEAALDVALARAFELVREHAPEDLPPGPAPTATPATWFDVAVGEEQRQVSEHNDAGRQAIRAYFAATKLNIGAGLPHWCGAFVAHCLSTAGLGATIPKGSAQARSWKSWGSARPVRSPEHPLGAVVVLSPVEPGTTGHVGFFVRYVGGTHVELLGGNQSDRVRRSQYALSRMVAVRWIEPAPAAAGAAAGPLGKFNFTGVVPGGREAVADLIIAKFAQAGYGFLQQAAALANAIAESGLDPKARNLTPREDSVGLFQLNRRGGVGTGFSVEQLEIAEVNISLIIDAARKHASFGRAQTLAAAVEAFVVKVERPANPTAAVQKRLAIAERLLRP